MLSKSLNEQFSFEDRTPVKPNLNRVLTELERRFVALESQRADFGFVIDRLLDVGIHRINEVLGPATERLVQLTELGWLIVTSGSSVILEVGEIKTWVVDPGPQRDLFVPTAFVTVQRVANTTDFAVCLVQGWNRLTGALTLEIQSVFGNPGPWSDWQISDAPGVTWSIQQWSDQVAADRVVIEDARDLSLQYRNTAQVAAELAQAGVGIDVATLVLRDGTRPFTQVITGVSPLPIVSGGELTTAAWVLGRLQSFVMIDGTRPFNATQRGVAPPPFANDDKLVTAAWARALVLSEIAALVGNAPAALNTVFELAAQLQADEGTVAGLVASVASRVRMGTGIGQTSNVVHLGWSAGNKLKATIDATDVGALATETWVASTFQPAGNYQPAGSYQANLGYTPVNKAGDTITGYLAVQGSATLFGWGGDADQSRLFLNFTGSRYLQQTGGTLTYQGGAISTSAQGRLWGATDFAAPTSSLRLAFAAYLLVAELMEEGPAGSVITGMARSSSGDITTKHRYLQVLMPSGWFTVGYV